MALALEALSSLRRLTSDGESIGIWKSFVSAPEQLAKSAFFLDTLVGGSLQPQ